MQNINNLSNEVVLHKNQEGIHYLQFRKLLKYPEIHHCYTMCQSEMNFRIYENDGILQASYDRICNVIDFDRNNIVKPHQTHTDKIEVVQNGSEKFDEVDGVITNQENITLCTTSADCTTLLFYDPVQKVIGDVHSGWRGTVQKIGQKAVKKMIEQYDCKLENIICCICPHIRKCHFEVEEDVAKLFSDTFSYMDDIQKLIVKSDIIDGKQKYHIDTTSINCIMLQEVGLKAENIIDSGICTVCEKKNFHSYRVDKETSGRNGAMIMLKH